MSASKTLLSHKTPTPEPGPRSTKVQEYSNYDIQDSIHTPSPKPNTFVSAFGRLWTAIKRPKSVLPKRLNGAKGLRKLIPRRTKKSTIPLETPPQRSLEAIDPADSDPASAPAPAPAPNPRAPSLSETISESPSQSDPPVLVPIITDSSISLHSQPDSPSTPNAVPGSSERRSVLDRVDGQFTPERVLPIPSSQASTLKDSDYVNDDSSRPSSGAEAFPTLEADIESVVDGIATAPRPTSPPPERPCTPRLQTELSQLIIPTSRDEDSYSTIRGRGSNMSSPADFHEMGSHFEGSPSR
jgi:hypothetical protein